MLSVDEKEINERNIILENYLAGIEPSEREKHKAIIQNFFASLEYPIRTLCHEDMYAYAYHLRSNKVQKEEFETSFDVIEKFVVASFQDQTIKRNPFTRLERGIPKCLGNASDQGSGEIALSSIGMKYPKIAESITESSTPSDRLSAIYFPYARSFNESFLKTCLLVYDELWFLDPLDRVTREELSLYREDGLASSPQWSRFIETYDQLYEAGFVRIYNDFGLYREYDDLLTYALESDIRDRDFVLKVNTTMGSSSWRIHKARLPENLRDLGFGGRWSYGVRNQNEEKWYTSPSSRDGFNDSRLDISRDERGYGTYQDFSSSYIMSLAHEYVHPVTGLSATINQAMLTCGLRGLGLVSDSPLAIDLLRHKYVRAWQAQNEGENSTDSSGTEYQMGIAKLGFEIIKSAIPSEEINRRSFDDLIKYREASKERLEAFQILVRELRADIEAHTWDKAFESEVRKIIDTKITPDLLKLRNDLQTIYEKMFGQIAGTAIKSITPSAVLSILPGLGFAQALALGATIGTGLAAISVQPILDAWAEQRSLKRNGIAWLLKIGK